MFFFFLFFCADATSYFGSLKEFNILEVDVDTVDKFDCTGISDGALELTSNSAKAVIQMVDACLSVVESSFTPLTTVVNSELINKVESTVRCGLRGIYAIKNVGTLDQTKRLKQIASILECMVAIVRHNELGRTSPEKYQKDSELEFATAAIAANESISKLIDTPGKASTPRVVSHVSG